MDGPRNGDGILPCNRCLGAGIVPTEPGGAGVPFYIGNARCSKCGGHGFNPCPCCVGFALRMPRPDPVAGPHPTEDMDVLTDSMSWLKQFPDSRMIARKRANSSRSGATAKTKDPVQPAQDTIDSSVLAFHFYAMHAHLTRRGSQKFQ
ncbi:hypothetical protein COCOBI_05-3220 [Coccomyxa sp. Obi]|nr:hypothetical protein COCOBI_05-3220 [Coccomyxa sp. Obi]